MQRINKRKYISFFVIILCLFSVLPIKAQGYAIAPCLGDMWMKFTQQDRINMLWGFVGGMEAAGWKCEKTFSPASKCADLVQYVANGPMSNSVAFIDKIYSDPANRRIEVLVVFLISSLKFKGVLNDKDVTNYLKQALKEIQKKKGDRPLETIAALQAMFQSK